MTIPAPWTARLLVAGVWEDGPRRAEIRSPWDGASAGSVPLAEPEQFERAAAGAAGAAREMARVPRHEKSRWCRETAARIRDEADDLARQIVRESGKPLQYARAEVARAVSTFTIAAEEALRLAGELLPLDIAAASERHQGFVVHVPIGPVAAIAPFNFPLNLVAHKLAPALAAGCPVVLKPPPQAPLTALRLAELILASGVPAGALSVLPMEIDLAERLATDERFRLLTFTGSARVGWHLKSIAGKKRVVLELGGNAPAIVHEDADLGWALDRCVSAGFAAAGQVCIKMQRLVVHAPVYDRFVAEFVERARQLPCGDPMDAATVVGPLIDAAAADRVMAWIAEARDRGAEVLCGGTREGNVVTPTVIADAPHDAFVMREEVFGPVTVVEKYDDFTDALARANAARYGLQAGAFTHDVRRIAEAVRELEFGGVIINDTPMFRVDHMPYGGVKDSGFGREGIRSALADLTEPRTVVLRL